MVGAAAVAAFTLASVAAWAASPPPKNPATCINQYHGKCKSTPAPKHCWLDGRPVACRPAGGDTAAKRKPNPTPKPAPPPRPTVPPVPPGYQIAESGQSTDGTYATADVFIGSPTNVEVRVTGGPLDDVFVVLGCSIGGSALPVQQFTLKPVAGLYPIAIPAGATNCEVVANASGTGTVTAQVLANGGTFTPGPLTTAPTTPSPTPTPPGKPASTDTVSPTTISLGSAGGCAGGNLTATIQITAPSNVSWTVKADPNSGDIGQVVAGSGNGSGSFTLTIHVGPQTPTFDCGHTVPMSESTLVDVTFSNGTIRGVTLYWTYIFVE